MWATEYFARRGFAPGATEWTTSYYSGAGSVAADGDTLIISSDFTNAVLILDPATGDSLQTINGLQRPTNAIRHGELIVASRRDIGNVVNAEDPSVTLLGDLGLPLGLASDGEMLYVGDYALGDVWAVNDAGATLLASELSSPEGLALDGDRLLVVETGTRQVTAIDLATGATSVVIEGLDYSDRIPEGFPFGQLAGVAVGPDGSIYVSDDGVNQVYEFASPESDESGESS